MGLIINVLDMLVLENVRKLEVGCVRGSPVEVGLRQERAHLPDGVSVGLCSPCPAV